MDLLRDPDHLIWLDAEAERLLTFGRASRVASGGFGWLDAHGALDPSHPVELWISCRMTHSFALSVLRGNTADTEFVDHGVGSLRMALKDHVNGGWFAAVGPDGPVRDAKEAYGHAFVILAASSAAAMGRPGSAQLLDEALGVFDRRFWDDAEGLAREEYAADWSGLSDYRGVNANMHTVEAYLAAADVAGRPDLLERALRITTRVVDGWARNNGWRLPEHFTSTVGAIARLPPRRCQPTPFGPSARPSGISWSGRD